MATQRNRVTLGKFILMTAATVIFIPLIIMLASGNWSWVEGWLLSLWFDIMMLSYLIYLFIKNPALLAERIKRPGSDDQKTWDKYLLIGAYVFSIIWFIMMPLDASRFKWSPAFPLWLKIIGGLMLLPSVYLIYQATAQNTFLSAMVRIQSERKQRLISTGVYGFVRHPLYLGGVLMLTGAPLLLGSLVGLAISAIMVAGLIIRINGEEEMLVDGLEGYREYREKVRYRLIPFIW